MVRKRVNENDVKHEQWYRILINKLWMINAKGIHGFSLFKVQMKESKKKHQLQAIHWKITEIREKKRKETKNILQRVET